MRKSVALCAAAARGPDLSRRKKIDAVRRAQAVRSGASELLLQRERGGSRTQEHSENRGRRVLLGRPILTRQEPEIPRIDVYDAPCRPGPLCESAQQLGERRTPPVKALACFMRIGRPRGHSVGVIPIGNLDGFHGPPHLYMPI